LIDGLKHINIVIGPKNIIMHDEKPWMLPSYQL
jgi:hypothetical protein